MFSGDKKKLHKTYCKTDNFSRFAHSESKIFIPKHKNR